MKRCPLLLTLILGVLFVSRPVLAKKTVVRVAMEEDCRPFSYLNSEEKQKGFSVSLLKSIARAAGFKVKISLMDSASALACVKAGEIDALMGSAAASKACSEEGFSVSRGYYSICPVLAVPADSPVRSTKDLEGALIGARKDTPAGDYAGELVESCGAALVWYASPYDLILAMESGQINALVEERSYLETAILGGTSSARILKKSEEEPLEAAFAVFGEEKEAIVSLFEAGLADTLSSGRYEELAVSWLGESAAAAALAQRKES